MGEIGGFLRIHRVGFDKREPRRRVGDYKQYFALQPTEELRRQCPGCGKVVKLHDAVCTRCGTELEFPDEPLAPEATPRQRAVV